MYNEVYCWSVTNRLKSEYLTNQELDVIYWQKFLKVVVWNATGNMNARGLSKKELEELKKKEEEEAAAHVRIMTNLETVVQ